MIFLILKHYNMSFFTAILSTIFASLSDIFFKKALQYKINLWNNDFLWQIFPLFIFILAYFYIDFQFDTTINTDFKVLLYVLLSFFMYTIGRYFHAKIFKVEKITHLLPYENLSKIFTIIFSFYLFADISKTTFFITLFTILVIILFTIDFKNLKFWKNILIFAFSHVLFALWNLITWYILLEASAWWLWVSWYSFITTYLIIWTLVFFIPFFWLKWFLELKNVDFSFYTYRWAAWILSWFSWFLSLVVIANLWLSISVLLSFLWIFSTLFFAFFILRDIPTKKDIILTILVLALISAWFYFK